MHFQPLSRQGHRPHVSPEVAHVPGRGIVLIDGGYFDNINNFAENQFGSQINVEEFSNALCDTFNVDLLRSKFYHAAPYQDGGEDIAARQSFFDAIDNAHNHQFERTGRVRQNHVTCTECGEAFTELGQKGVDVGIAVDLVDMAHQQGVDAFILVSGDEDLTHAVETAKEQLANVYLAFAARSAAGLYVSDKLSTEVDTAINLADDGYLSECLMD